MTPFAQQESLSRFVAAQTGAYETAYAELAAGRPVIYSGSKAASAHAFICDGYDGNGMFHINWGWNGKSNGYFLLNVLNPEEQGTGSADGPYGYIYTQAAIVDFQPNNGGSFEFEMTAAQVKLESYIDTRESADDPFTAYVSGRFYNYTSSSFPVRMGWGLFQGDEMIQRLSSSYGSNSTPGSYYTHTNKELNFGQGLSDGTYRIVPICSEYEVVEWRPCAGADRNYIEVTIDGNQCYFTGYGTAGDRNYVINDISFTGNMHNNRPVNINVNMTNNGTSSNTLLYMYADGEFFGTAFVGLDPDETGDIIYMYMSATAGDHTLTWSWNEDGSDPIATRTLTLDPMPAANLSATIQVLDVTDTSAKIITSDSFSVLLTITNNGSTTYDEDISAKLFKNTKGTSGTAVQGLNQHLTLAPGETTTMQIDMTNVYEGWKYFVKTYYYSEGKQTDLKGTSSYTIVFPEIPEPILLGDVNGDNQVSVLDVSLLIDYLLGANVDIDTNAADYNQDQSVSVLDVSLLIDWLLSGSK